MDPPKPPNRISFKLGEKRKFSTESVHHNSSTDQGETRENNATQLEHSSTIPAQGVTTLNELEVTGEGITAKATTPAVDTHFSDKSSKKPASAPQLLRPPDSPTMSMTEPPAKRAKRTDSSAMWERNSSRAADTDHRYGAAKEMSNGRDRRDHRDLNHRRDDGRRSSRSRDRKEKRRDRSRSRDRDDGRYKNGERGGDRDRRNRERTTSRERHRSRRGG